MLRLEATTAATAGGGSSMDVATYLCMAELQSLRGAAATRCRRLDGDATTPTVGAGTGGRRCCIREVGELQPRRPVIGGAGTTGRRSCIYGAKMLRRASGFAETRESRGCERRRCGAASTVQKCYDRHRVLLELERAGATSIGVAELHASGFAGTREQGLRASAPVRRDAGTAAWRSAATEGDEEA